VVSAEITGPESYCRRFLVKLACERMKRLVDLTVSLSLLLLLSPLMLVIALLVRCLVGSPVIFRQARPGLNAEPFELLKFRTMWNGDQNDEQRLTRFGRMLRSTSLDELPELWNIAYGDMSLVGPRPLLMDYLPLYSERQARRHLVRPGLTGLAQISGRNLVDWDERLELDVSYVENHSRVGDLKIMAQTVLAVLSRQGVSAEGVPTMREFEGSSETELKL